MKKQQWECPECRRKINKLKLGEISQWGYCKIEEDEDGDVYGGDIIDEYINNNDEPVVIYLCPECNKQIELEELISTE